MAEADLGNGGESDLSLALQEFDSGWALYFHLVSMIDSGDSDPVLLEEKERLESLVLPAAQERVYASFA